MLDHTTIDLILNDDSLSYEKSVKMIDNLEDDNINDNSNIKINEIKETEDNYEILDFNGSIKIIKKDDISLIKNFVIFNYEVILKVFIICGFDIVDTIVTLEQLQK